MAANTVRDLMSPEKRLLSSEKGEHYLTLIDKKSAPQKLEDDPDTMKLIQPRVMSTAYTSEAQIQQVEGEVDALLQNNRITATTIGAAQRARPAAHQAQERGQPRREGHREVARTGGGVHQAPHQDRGHDVGGLQAPDGGGARGRDHRVGKESYAAGGKQHPQEW